MADNNGGNEEGESDHNNVSDNLSDGGKEVKDTLITNPTNDWGDEKTIGVVVGATVALALLLGLLWCCKTDPCRKRGGARKSRNTLCKPNVTKSSATSAVNGYDKLPPGAIMHGAQKLRDAGMDGEGVKVGVIDSGIDSQHRDFNGRVVRQEWYRLGTPLAIDDHGTHVAGTIHFMAPKADLYDYRVIGASGEIDGDTAAAEAIRDAVEDGCQVINMSLRISYPVVKDIKRAVEYAYSKGVIMVCALGNDGNDDPIINETSAYPARWKETISVAAVKKGGTPVASFSGIVGIGPGFRVNIAGIGENVVSLKPGGGYQTMSGTSMAAPHITGLIAALMTDGGPNQKELAKQVRSDLSSKCAIDVNVKGKEGSSRKIGFATFLPKTDFNKFWRRYSSGIANIGERQTIRNKCNEEGEKLSRRNSKSGGPPSTGRN